MPRLDLQQRLIQFAIDIINVSNSFKSTEAAFILRKQLIRSATSTALNFGESRSAESSRDFLHKSRIVLKELRESHVALTIVDGAGLCDSDKMKSLLNESNQLVAIFVASVRTSENNLKKSTS